jgi:glutathione peroxidase
MPYRQKEFKYRAEKTFALREISSASTRLNGTMQLFMSSITEAKMHRRLFVLQLGAVLCCGVSTFAEEKPVKKTVYDFSLIDMDGKVVPLSNYRGKILLIVNLASQSVYSSQIAALSDLEKAYSSQGLAILGIPSPDFGGEELKDPAAMRKYYVDIAHAKFSVFASATITGVHAVPLYRFLCDPKQSVPGGDIHWNFTKFLIDREGKPLARYEVGIDPADIDFHVTIESALAGKLKPQASGKDKKENASDDDDDGND